MKKLLIIFVLIFLTKAFFAFQVPSPWVFGDAYVYGAKTRAILTEGNFNFDAFHYGGPQIPPLYSIVLLPAYFFSSMNTTFHAILIWNAFLSTLTIIPIFLLARKFLCERTARGAGRSEHTRKPRQALFIAAAVGFLPGSWGYVYMVMSENIFLPMVAWSVYFMYRMITDDKPLKWQIAMGLTLAGLMLTKATAIAFVVAYGFFAFIQILSSKKKEKFINNIKGQLVVLIALGLPLLWWSLIKEPNTAPHFTAGYNTSYYTDIIAATFSSAQEFGAMLRLVAHEFAYYGVATWLIGLPLLLSYMWIPPEYSKHQKELRKLQPVIGYVLLSSVFLMGLSALHMKRFIDVNPERYTIFGRYIESTVPILIGLGSILLFKKTLPQKWRMPTLGLFLLMAVATIFSLPHINYDLVANIPIWSLQFLNSNIIILVLIGITALGFFSILKPKFTPVLLSLMIIGSFASMPLPFKDALRQSNEIEAQISGIRDWVIENTEPNEIIGFDEEKIWTHNYIRQFWALKFWLKNPIQKITRLESTHPYIISPEELPQQKVAESWELKLYVQ